jgi:hypothetical protein
MTQISVTLARTASGSVDVAASLAAFESAVHLHIAEKETELATIAAAASLTFDELKANGNPRVNMPFVINETVRRLNPLPANYNALTAAVGQYLRDNAGPREEGKLFGIGKGKGAGVTRWSDVPAQPEAK